MSMEPTPISRKIQCPRCAKSLYFTQEDCGHLLYCTACGAATRVPRLPPEMFLPAEETSPDPEMDEDEMIYGIPVPQTTYTPSPPPPEPDPVYRRRWSALVTLLLCLILALLLTVVWLVNDRPPVIAAATRTAMLETKQQADESLARGDLLAAHRQYQNLQEMAAKLDVRDDPQIGSVLGEARQSQGLVLEKLLRREAVRQTMAPPTTEPAVPPATQPSMASVASVEPTPATRPAAIVVPSQPIMITPATRPVIKLVLPFQTQSPLVLPKRPPVRSVSMPHEELSDEEIGKAIERLVNNLLGQMNGTTIRGTRANNTTSMGVNALCVYALLQAGQAISDERLNVRAKFMKDVLSAMRDMPVGGGPETYTRGLRATALALYNRPEDRQQLKADVAWLVAHHNAGAYSYTRTSDRDSWDNSNSQYGLLGVWSGAEVGIEVPSAYWSAVDRHWTSNQCPDGEWSYKAGSQGSGRLSMSVAGIASLFVTHDYLDAPAFGSVVGRNPFSAPLARGLTWLEAGNNALPGSLDGYTLYGIERVGLASGFKYFGNHDWYRELAKLIIDGHALRGRTVGRFMGGDQSMIQSAYCLLFLARGRHPILMNKLRFDGAWANRPRSVANLARYASTQLERPLNWQVVPLSRDWTDWTDSPILYLASHEPVPLKEQDYVKLRRYINSGGMLFTQADGGSAKFNEFVLELARKLTPEYEWADVPEDHDLYGVNFPITLKPKLRCISNGVRLLIVHSPEDISQWLQLRAEKTRQPVFDLGANLFIYAAGKTDLRNRLTSTLIPPPRDAAGFTVRIAQVRYGGNWNPEPGALERFASLFQYQTGYALQRDPVDMEDLRANRWPIAVMTGTAAYTPPAKQIEAIRKFVEEGGTLYIDAAGGSGMFAMSVRNSLLATAFPGKATVLLNETHPIIAGSADGMDGLTKPQLRPYAERLLGRAAARVEMLAAGNGRVIFSPVDTTFGLLGTNTWGVLGYKPAYAQGLLKNVILWAMDGGDAGH